MSERIITLNGLDPFKEQQSRDKQLGSRIDVVTCLGPLDLVPNHSHTRQCVSLNISNKGGDTLYLPLTPFQLKHLSIVLGQLADERLS